MIKVHSIGSSSSGNSFIVQDGATTILLDVGFPPDVIRSKLFQLGLTPKDITGVLITHEHQDHISGINFLKGVPKYMTKGTFEAAHKTYQINRDEVTFIEAKKQFQIGKIIALPMTTQHDAKEPVSYIVKNTSGEKIVFITDTGIANMIVKNADMYIIEANYIAKNVERQYEAGEFEEARYKRLINTHLSNEQSLEYLKKCVGPKTKKVILMHMSPRNSNPVGTMNWFRARMNTDMVEFIHPVNHKFKKHWEVGYIPTRKRTF